MNFPTKIMQFLVTLALSMGAGFLFGQLIWNLLPNKTRQNPPVFSSCLTFPPSFFNNGPQQQPYYQHPDQDHGQDHDQDHDQEPHIPRSSPTPSSTSAWSWPHIEQEMERLSLLRRRPGKLYVITPTKRGRAQVPNLVRTAQALYPVRKFVTWLIYEDTIKTQSRHPNHLETIAQELEDFTSTELGYDIHIEWSRIREKNERVFLDPKGVEARRDGLDWVRKHSGGKGVVFFGDDDNTYDSDLFRQILTLMSKQVSIWPVGLVTPYTQMSAPVVNQQGVTIDIHDGFRVNRAFPIDFGGFAVSVKLLLKKPNATIPYIAGYEESTFLKNLGISIKEIQPLANGATEMLSYHTQTRYMDFKTECYNEVKRAEDLLQVVEELRNTNIVHLYLNYAFSWCFN